MPIYEKAQCIEISIPKTGTTSRYSLITGVPKSLDISRGANYGRCDSLESTRLDLYNFFVHGHFTYIQLQKWLKTTFLTDKQREAYSAFPTFCFVRNPYDRYISFWYHCRRQNPYLKYDFDYGFDKFTDQLFFAYNNNMDIDHLQPIEREFYKECFVNIGTQSEFILDQNNNIGVDFVLRLENLETEYNNLREHISHLPPFDPSIHLNKSANRVDSNYQKYYNIEIKEKVYKMFEKDFKILGYDNEL